MVARPWDDVALFSLAHAYEQRTRHRRPPPLFGPLSAAKRHSTQPPTQPLAEEEALADSG